MLQLRNRSIKRLYGIGSSDLRVRLRSDLVEEIREQARVLGMSMSYLVNAVLERHLLDVCDMFRLEMGELEVVLDGEEGR